MASATRRIEHRSARSEFRSRLALSTPVVLGRLRVVLTLVGLFTVLFTRHIPRSLFDAVAMAYRYEWRVTTYACGVSFPYPADAVSESGTTLICGTGRTRSCAGIGRLMK